MRACLVNAIMPKKLATKTATSTTTKTRGNNPTHDVPAARDKSSSRPSRRAPNSSVNRKARTVIELKCATDVLAALRHAVHIDRAPNRHMVINLEAVGIEAPVKAVGRLMKLMRDRLRRRGVELCYIWVREVGEIVGEHVHILFHLPHEQSDWFARRKSGWLKLCGAKPKRGASITRIIRGAGTVNGSQVTSRELFEVNLRNVTAYVLKHCSTDVQRHLGIISEGPCPVVGKRVSISENLHRVARTQCPHCISH